MMSGGLTGRCVLGLQLPAPGFPGVLLGRGELQEQFPQVDEALGTQVSHQQLGVPE